MADNEILKDAELDKVVGGSGIETMALMNRLQVEGLAKFKTPLVAGNEAAAAKELQSFLENVVDNNHRQGFHPFAGCQIHYDDKPNLYSGFLLTGNDQHIGADNVIEILRNIK
ncbi:MAG: hypothetical protein J5809_08095 [Selenomonadaceae bacterium]|nr:hypothetical protein [Selenomonadaceae bacterium]